MVGIICLIIGIVGFVKGRINVSRRRELRGAGMYIVATLFCLPLPLSFLVGVCIGVIHAANRTPTPVDPSTILIANVASAWLPLGVAIILAFAMAKPKELGPTAPPASGFPVLPPTAPGSQGPTGTPLA